MNERHKNSVAKLAFGRNDIDTYETFRDVSDDLEALEMVERRMVSWVMNTQPDVSWPKIALPKDRRTLHGKIDSHVGLLSYWRTSYDASHPGFVLDCFRLIKLFEDNLRDNLEYVSHTVVATLASWIIEQIAKASDEDAKDWWIKLIRLNSSKARFGRVNPYQEAVAEAVEDAYRLGSIEQMCNLLRWIGESKINVHEQSAAKIVNAIWNRFTKNGNVFGGNPMDNIIWAPVILPLMDYRPLTTETEAGLPSLEVLSAASARAVEKLRQKVMVIRDILSYKEDFTSLFSKVEEVIWNPDTMDILEVKISVYSGHGVLMTLSLEEKQEEIRKCVRDVAIILREKTSEVMPEFFKVVCNLEFTSTPTAPAPEKKSTHIEA